MPSSDQYAPAAALGSTDWTGNRAPAGGTHTGTSTITMVDSIQYVVAHGVAEVRRKLDLHASPPPSSGLIAWVAFDVPLSAVPIVLDASRIAGVR